jgi:hypothetical protein
MSMSRTTIRVYPCPKEEKRELQGIPGPVNSNEQYQGLGKRSAHAAGLVVEKVPSWKHRKVDVPRAVTLAMRWRLTEVQAGSKISLRTFRKTSLILGRPGSPLRLSYLVVSGSSLRQAI